ncbi:DUF4287 domain-containing protein [uncultured Maricaulis sp.]|uniref:DUF4287 domain-containing protein n=1 Tax=uncultured Maricaulis sp. TaxID=174710 RepID=UPI0030DBE374|tara:strand:+ start:2596 stop:3165 length:570 start_codon:yes stop_codon:yes gene_type:complete
MATPDEMMRSMVANMPAKTGRSLDEWLVLARAAPEPKHGKIIAWLKGEHGLTHGYANLVATAHLSPERLAPPTARSDADLIEAQYAGKEILRPIHDRLSELALQLGDDVELAPKKTYVSLRRSKQFAIIQPSTKTRIDLGLNLGDLAPTGRLEAFGPANAMVSHRVRLEDVDAVDAEVMEWLRLAYNAA